MKQVRVYYDGGTEKSQCDENVIGQGKGRGLKPATKNLGAYLKQGGQPRKGFQEKDDAVYTPNAESVKMPLHLL